MKVIITGVTGMVGEGVLHECLNNSIVEEILVINRKPCGIRHFKLKEVIHLDFFDVSSIKNEFLNYDTCFFCLGVSSIGVNEASYYNLTYMLTMNFAKTLVETNPSLTFCYISGSGTDSTEKGKIMWARIKGKTENELIKLPFHKVFAFRPGILKPTHGLKNTLKFYKYLGWLYPILKTLFPNSATSLEELGIAMIVASNKGYSKQIIEVKDILILSKKN